jgi:DNA-binding beta-propeller fold protein YncE
MLEMIDFKKPTVEGIVTVQLIEATSGKIVDGQKVKNMITTHTLDRMKWKQKEEFFRDCAHQSGLVETLYPFTHIGLFSSDKPVQDVPIPDLGLCVGWAQKLSPYSGSNRRRGTINQSESYATPEIAHYVFDWPTHAANGTHRTIAWGNISENIGELTGTVITSFNSPDYYPYGLAWDGQYLWLTGYSAKKIYKLDPTDGTVITSFNSPDKYPYGLAWDGQYLWLTGYSANKIYKLDPTDGTVITSFNSPDSSPYGLAWDGQYLWLTGYSAKKIYKLDPTDGTVITSFNSPDKYPYGLAWDGQYLWLAGSSAKKIYKLDPTDGTVITSFNSPDSSPCGLAWDGQYLWLTGYSANKIYKLACIIGAQTLLASPVTKTSLHTLKVQYDFVFQE